MELGWITTEVGRQPWIVYRVLRVADAVNPQPGIQYSFYAVVGIYAVLTVATVAVLRRMTRASPVPAGPAGTGRGGVHGHMNLADTMAAVLWLGVTCYALLGGADFGGGFWDLVAGGARRGAPAAPADRALDRPGLGSQPRLAHLRAGGHVDVLPAAVRGGRRPPCGSRSPWPRSA